MFDEVVLRVDLGCKILPGHLISGRFGQGQGESVVAISHTLDKLVVHDPSSSQQVGSNNNNGDLSAATTNTNNNNNNFGLITPTTTATATTSEKNLASIGGSISPSVYYIAVKDVIKTVSVKRIKISPFAPEAGNNLLSLLLAQQGSTNVDVDLDTTNENQLSKSEAAAAAATSDSGLAADSRLMANSENVSLLTNDTQFQQQQHRTKDLLLIGCSNSVLIYDAFNQSNLLNLNTPTSINAISGCSSKEFNLGGSSSLVTLENELTVCGGPQRIYALKFEFTTLSSSSSSVMQAFENKQLVSKSAAAAISSSSSYNIHAEVSSERSTGDTINCLAQGYLNGIDLVLTGSIEQKIRLYQLDSFDQNIQACRLTIDEGAQINCLCPINTQSHTTANSNQQQMADLIKSSSSSSPSSLLPSIMAIPADQHHSGGLRGEQMNYFAYATENGYIGVYRLFHQQHQQQQQVDGIQEGCPRILAERLWRNKCKYTPIAMMMYDINGDGLDELVVGFKNSRLEVHSPFTGQLLAVNRCFKSNDRLVGLCSLDYQATGRHCLLACSTSGSLIGFRPRISRPRVSLRGYTTLPSQQQQHDLQTTTSEDAWAATTLKTIEEEQEQIQIQRQRDIFMKGGVATGTSEKHSQLASSIDLHIESQTDDTKPTKCDVKQSLDLLLKINALQIEQMELERRACHIYHMNVNQASEFYPSDVGIAYKWNFDSIALCLRLTIVVSTSMETVKLIKIEDESKIFLSSGYLLLNPSKTTIFNGGSGGVTTGGGENTTSSLSTGQSSSSTQKSHVIVIPLRSTKNLEVRLDLKVFCEYLRKVNDSTDLVKLARVYCKPIDVPKFAMFTFAPDQNEIETTTTSSQQQPSKPIRMTFQLRDSSKVVQFLDWLHESFLCFQFRLNSTNRNSKNNNNNQPTSTSDSQDMLARSIQLSGSQSQQQQHQQQLSLLPMTMMVMMMDDKSKNFDLTLVDVRRTLEKMEAAIGGAAGGCNQEMGKEEEEETHSLAMLKGNESSEFVKFCSKLRLVHSNGTLSIECENPDLIEDLVQSLVIDRLHLELPSSSSSSSSKAAAIEIMDDEQTRNGELVLAELEPLVEKLDKLTKESRQLEESERRIQTELYESADYTRNLMQQFGIANELNEFSIAKELLSELFIMLNGAQNAARAHCLNNRSRKELLKQVGQLEGRISFLSGTNVRN